MMPKSVVAPTEILNTLLLEPSFQHSLNGDKFY